LTYKLEIFHRDPKTKLGPAKLKEIHPLGKSPVISIKTSESAEPVIIAESALIIEYLIDHYGKGTSLLPKQWKEGQEEKACGETEEWMRYRYFLHYGEGSLMSFLIVGLIAGSKQAWILLMAVPY
jgi:glutathione S-transferase